MLKKILGAVMALTAALMMATAHGQAPEKKKLTIAVGGKGLFYYLPLTIAERQGYFKEQGLEVEIPEVRAAGEPALDFGSHGVEDAGVHRLENRDAWNVAQGLNGASLFHGARTEAHFVVIVAVEEVDSPAADIADLSHPVLGDLPLEGQAPSLCVLGGVVEGVTANGGPASVDFERGHWLQREPAAHVPCILHGHAAVTTDMALRLHTALGTSPGTMRLPPC